jgi:hypothetical protein
VSKSSKSNSTSTTNTDSTLVNTPTNPQFVTDSVSNLQDHINNLLNSDPQSLVAGPSSLQTQAFNTAQGLGGWQPSMSAAATGATGLLNGPGLTPAQAQAGTATTATAAPTLASSGTLLNTDLSKYENPYENAVVNTTLSDFDQNAAQTRANQALAMARDQKFGGSRSALTSALTEDQLARARAAAEAGLRSDAFNAATANATNDLNRSADTSRLNAQLGTQASLFNAGAANDTSKFNTNLGADTSQFNAGQVNSMGEADAQRRLAAAGLLGDLSNSTGANDRADLGLLSDLGGQQRQIAMDQAAAPASLLSIIAGLNAEQPYNLFHGGISKDNSTATTNGSSTSSSSDPFGTLGTLLGGIGSVASGLGGMGVHISDRRLKTDIETVGKDKAGRRVVSFRYRGEPKGANRIGYLAQEVERSDPEAILTLPGGVKAVDYGLLSQKGA